MPVRNALQIAARLIKLGLCPVALKSPDDQEEQAKPVGQRGKRPILYDWNDKPCPQSIADMPELKPEHNVGIRTGYVEGARHQLIVLDEDSEAAHWFCEQTFAPTSMITETGRVTAGWRGRHRFYRRPNIDKCPNRAVKVLWRNPFNDDQPEVLALDVRADGGQVVAPGSLHGTGGLYEEAVAWTEEMLASLPVLSFELLERSIADVKATSKATEDKFPQKLRVRRFRAYLEKCAPSKPQMPPGGAGTHCLGIARAGVWGLDLPPDVVAKEMHESNWNKKCCFDDGSPYPWSIEELKHKCRDAARAETSSGAMEKRRGWMLEEPERSAEKHVIELTAQVSQTATEVLQALADARDSCGSPLVYSQGEHLITVHPSGTHWLDRHSLSIAMDRSAIFQVHKEKERRHKGEVIDVEIEVEQKKPPMDIADKILSMGHWPELPILRRVSKLPPVTLAGCLGLRPGYDLHSQTYYLGGSLEVPERPTREEAIAAAQRLLRYVRALKFATKVDQAKWLAYLLTLATRTAYDKCPMFLVHATEQGSGKTSALVVGYKLLYSGDLIPADYKEGDDSEWAKSLYGWSQMPLILWDNVPDGRCVRHPKLAMILTSGKGTARELGKNRELQADFTSSVFALTGNKVTLDFDLACRATVINLLGKPDRDPTFSPEGNRHFDAVRPRALQDVYTIVRAWALAGCPPVHCSPHDRFGEWSQVVQQLVLWLGFPDPVTDNDSMNADKEYLRQFHFETHSIFGDKVWRTSELFDKFHNGERAAIEAVSAAAELCRRRRAESAIMLGQNLKVLADRPGEDFKLVNRGIVDGYQRYQVQRLAQEGISEARENTSNVKQLFQADQDDPVQGKQEKRGS